MSIVNQIKIGAQRHKRHCSNISSCAKSSEKRPHFRDENPPDDDVKRIKKKTIDENEANELIEKLFVFNLLNQMCTK